MSDLALRLYTNPILHKVCDPVQKIDEDLVELVGKMFLTMMQNRGCGLAAPQVGISKQVIVMMLDNNAVTMINPKILNTSRKKNILEEGCLSSPKVFVPVKRYDAIDVEYLNLKGITEIESFEGFNARIVQHEVDHLLGKLIVDNI
jgi:peptide deformylase